MSTEIWLGALGKAKEIYLHDGGAARTAKEIWFHDGSAPRKIFSGFAPQSGNYASIFTGGPAVLAITFNSNGTVNYVDEGPTLTGNWGTPTSTGAGAGYFLFVTLGVGSGTMSAGTFSTWLSLASNQTFTMSSAPNLQARARAASYVISTSVGGPTVASGNLNWANDRT